VILNDPDPFITKKGWIKGRLINSVADQDTSRILMAFRIMSDFDIVAAVLVCRGIYSPKTAPPMYIRETLQRCFARL
jgi:hypothetical protein